jgi:superfamily II DNA or RNA helicase
LLREVLNLAKPKYYMPDERVISDVLIPGIANSTQIDCMSAYFNVAALRELAPGLAQFIASSSGTLRLLVSVQLSPEEFEFPKDSIDGFARVLEEKGANELEEFLQTHTKECLAWLRKFGRLEVKVVIKKQGLFHPKQWHFIDGEDVAVLSGSANVTLAGLTTGVETYTLSRTWTSLEAKEVWNSDQDFWNEYWDNKRDDAISISLDDAILHGYLSKYEKDAPPSESLFKKALEQFGTDEGLGSTEIDEPEGLEDEPVISGVLSPPKSFVWDSGSYKHQGDAVKSWEAGGHRGILEMATGSGKTLTSLLAASRLIESNPLLIVIAVPNRVLLKQWIDDCNYFGVQPYVADETFTQDAHLINIKALMSAVKNKTVRQQLVIVTHDFIKNKKLSEYLSKPVNSESCLLIADEVHKLSLDTFLKAPPTVKYRLGLSATPWRQNEADANKGLVAYFGPVLFSFPLEKAIGVCLVPYDYQAKLVQASDIEVEYWLEQRAAYAAWLGTCDKPLSAANRKLAAMKGKQMRRWIEASSSKIQALKADLLATGPENVRRTLIYCTSAEPSQMIEVNSLLSSLGIPWAQITQNETKEPKKVKAILRAFKNGDIRVLTAKKVLDEGFNAPAIDTAYFLASSTSTREWIQRRGRVLRLSPGKEKSNIYDYGVVAPQLEGSKEDDFARGDLLRIKEFFRLSIDGEDRLQEWVDLALAQYPNLSWPPLEFSVEEESEESEESEGDENV